MNKKITVFDYLNRETVEVLSDELEFRISVYGILIKDKQLLIHTTPWSKNYNIPGGKIEKGELTKETLIREFKEETGLIVEPTELIAVKENFVRLREIKSYHSILIFYLVKDVGGTLGKLDNKEGDSEETKFVPLDEQLLKDMEPVFIDVIKANFVIKQILER